MSKRDEKTFIMVKPDGVQRALIGVIMCRFEHKGLNLIAAKLVSPTQEHFENHYSEHKTKPFFKGLVHYMISGPVFAMVWQGLNAVKVGRALVGETNPANSSSGTIRGDFCLETGRNLIHASDSVENAEKEINLWFNKSEVLSYSRCDEKYVYEV